MSSLTDTAYYSRNTIKYGSVGLIIFLVLWSSVSRAINTYKLNRQNSTPDVRYGRLPPIAFPEKSFQTKSFSLELPKDTFPKTPPVAKVLVVYRPVSTLLALDQDTQTAKKIGFTSKPVEIRTGVYQFTRPDSDLVLVMNILEGSFTVSYPYKEDQLLITSKSLPDKNQAIQIANGYLSAAGKLTPDLENGTQSISYWQISSQGIKKVASYSEANATRVDFLRQKIDNSYPIVSHNPDSAPVSVLLSASTVESKRVIEVSYKYAPIDQASFSYYPIISPQEAFDKLKAGQYWPARDSQAQSVAIKSMYLAYYEPSTLTNFMLPIYVFEGTDGFVAYISAVSPSYISQ